MSESAVYFSSEDSMLLRRALTSLVGPKATFLEIGVGYGSNLKDVALNYALVVGTDVQSFENMKLAKMNLKQTENVELILADKASCFRAETFDVVAFNPPYLPSTETINDRTVDGGLAGIQVPLGFLKDSLKVARQDGEIIILLSSLSDIEEFKKFCRSNHLYVQVLASKSLFFETLHVFRITRQLEKLK